jgi:hypothetical protein
MKTELKVKSGRELYNSITPEIVKAGMDVFLAKTLVLTIRPIVEAYHKKVLLEREYMIDDKWLSHETKHRIIEQKEDYLMSDDDAKIYFQRLNEERIASGLHVDNPEFCPLLVAEHNVQKAIWKLAELFAPITGIKWEDIHKLEHYRKYEDIMLGFVANYMKDEGISQ